MERTPNCLTSKQTGTCRTQRQDPGRKGGKLWGTCLDLGWWPGRAEKNNSQYCVKYVIYPREKNISPYTPYAINHISHNMSHISHISYLDSFDFYMVHPFVTRCFVEVLALWHQGCENTTYNHSRKNNQNTFRNQRSELANIMKKSNCMK